VAQRRQAVHPRHLDVECHHIGLKRRELGQALLAIGGAAGDLVSGSRADDAAQAVAHQGGIIDD